MVWLLSLVLFCFLFLISRYLTESISGFFYHITHRHVFSIQLLAVLFLPGVIIHELSHWLVASLLFVPTGEIEFFPQVYGNTVKLGSVQVAKTDPARRFFIGVAPLIMGMALLLGVFWYLSPSLTQLSWKTGVFLYCLFEIGNTMFSSKKDLEDALVFVILFILFVILLLFLHVPVQQGLVSLANLPQIAPTALRITQFLLITIGIDCIVILILTSIARIKRI